MRLVGALNPIPPLKRLTSMVFQTAPWRGLWLPRSNVNYHRAVGDGTGSSTVMAPLLWVARTFPEAPPALWQQLPDGQEEQVLDHAMLRLLTKPNEHYQGVTLSMATCLDWL